MATQAGSEEPRVKFCESARVKYLECLRETGRLCEAAAAAGVSRHTALDHRKADPEFEREVQDALAVYAEKLLKHTDDLCLNGYARRTLTRSGKLIELHREYPVPLIALRLKGFYPELRDSARLEVSGSMQLDVKQLSDEELNARVMSLANGCAAAHPLLPAATEGEEERGEAEEVALSSELPAGESDNGA